MSDEQITAEATPAGELRRQILSQCVAKNEREWWAARTIEKLEFELNAANDRIKRMENIIFRASTSFFEDGSDRVVAVAMLMILDEAKEAKP